MTTLLKMTLRASVVCLFFSCVSCIPLKEWIRVTDPVSVEALEKGEFIFDSDGKRVIEAAEKQVDEDRDLATLLRNQ